MTDAGLQSDLPAPASWAARSGAFGIDVLLGAAVFAVLACLAFGSSGWGWWVFTVAAVLVFAVVAANRWLVPAVYGRSLGRAFFGIWVPVLPTGDGAGIGRLVLRDLAHLLDTGAFMLGWFCPLWDPRGRTFADMLVHTEVHPKPGQVRPRKPVARTLTAAALISVGMVGLGYATQYHRDQTLADARQQIADQGPRIVEQVLSYGKDSYQQDFARARTLVTDQYRPKLIADEQNAVRHAGGKLMTNQYWAVSSAVIDVAPRQASMLMALQGQRGGDVKSLNFSTATVRAGFVKVGDAWKLAALDVLRKPQAGGGR